MAVRIGINGFGRIGRLVFRAAHQREGLEVVAVNDLSDAATLAMLLKNDTVHRRFPGSVEAANEAIMVDGAEVRVLSQKDPAALPWQDLGVQIVVESTGVFRERALCMKHVEAGAQKVLLTVPAKDEVDATIVLGVNDEALEADDVVVSNASCTTNCLGPMVKVLHDAFGVAYGLMTTIHAYTNDQRILDLVHKDPRRARAAAQNIIPTTTGAARAIGKVIPELNGKLDGMAMRVPVMDGSVVDFVARLDKAVSADDVNAAFREASEGRLQGILEYSQEPLVSSDIIGNAHSCVFDSEYTALMEGRMVKVIGWYDNEWGYSNRVVDLIERMAALV